jgi:hypothetical protein
MFRLNRDVHYLIFEELKDCNMPLFSCLLVNRTWCGMIIPLLWKDPWRRLIIGNEKSLFNIIVSHLSDELRNNLSKILKISYKRPLFNYISFCKSLNVSKIEDIIYTSTDHDFRRGDDYLLYEEEIFKLFINNNMKYTSLYISKKIGYDTRFILNSGTKECFSEIEFLTFRDIDEEILIGLSEICKSIKKLDYFVYANNQNGIVKLIDAQKNLKEVFFDFNFNTSSRFINLEKSLIKHEKTIEHIKLVTYTPITNIFSYFKNLKILKVENVVHRESWDQLAAASLPSLQILNATEVPINILASLIEKTKGDLKEIKIDFVEHDDTNNKRLIQAIYQNCPKLKYLELSIGNSISEFEKLLINCKYLDGLYILMYITDWERLFEVLIRSSPTSLFKFKFRFYKLPEPEHLKLFLDKWKGRHPMLLQTIPKNINVRTQENNYYMGIIEEYKAEGVVKKHDDYYYCGYSFEDFEWIRSEKIQFI